MAALLERLAAMQPGAAWDQPPLPDVSGLRLELHGAAPGSSGPSSAQSAASESAACEAAAADMVRCPSSPDVATAADLSEQSVRGCGSTTTGGFCEGPPTPPSSLASVDVFKGGDGGSSSALPAALSGAVLSPDSPESAVGSTDSAPRADKADLWSSAAVASSTVKSAATHTAANAPSSEPAVDSRAPGVAARAADRAPSPPSSSIVVTGVIATKSADGGPAEEAPPRPQPAAGNHERGAAAKTGMATVLRLGTWAAAMATFMLMARLRTRDDNLPPPAGGGGVAGGGRGAGGGDETQPSAGVTSGGGAPMLQRGVAAAEQAPPAARPPLRWWGQGV